MSIFHTIKTVIKAVANTSAEETRRAPLPGELETLVMEEIRLLLAIGLEFTAYTVTQNLRAKYPDIDIMHRAVRPIIFKAEGSEALNFDLPADWHTTHREVNGSRVRVFVPGPAPKVDETPYEFPWSVGDRVMTIVDLDEDYLYSDGDGTVVISEGSTGTVITIDEDGCDNEDTQVKFDDGRIFWVGSCELELADDGDKDPFTEAVQAKVNELVAKYDTFCVLNIDRPEIISGHPINSDFIRDHITLPEGWYFNPVHEQFYGPDYEDDIFEAYEIDDDDGIHVDEILESPRNVFLRDFVRLYFDRKIAIGQPFTAWDITQAMRADNPGAELPHGEVIRSIVHSFDVPDGWTVIWNPDMGARVFTPDTPSSEGDGETDIEAHVNLVNSMVDWSLVPPALRPRSMADDDDLDAWMDENPDLTVQGAMSMLDRLIDGLKEEVEETLDDNVKLIRDLKKSAIEDFDVRSIGKVLLFIIGNMMSNPDVDRFTIEEIANGTSWDPAFIRERIKEENWYNSGWMNWGWGANDSAFIRYRGPREWFAENRESDSEWPYDLRTAYMEWCSSPRLGGMHPGWRQMTVTELFDIDPSVSARTISFVQQAFYKLVAAGQPFTAYQVTLELRRDLPHYNITNLHVQLVLFDVPVPDGWGRAIVEHDTGDHVMLYRPINKES